MTDPWASLVARCGELGVTVATAESLTAGLVATRIADVPGASAVLRGGVVAYATDVKHDVLGVDASLLGHVVSEEVARAMAQRACAVLGAGLGIGTTGVAGPDSLDGQPPGTAWIAVHLAHGRAGETVARLLEVPGDRAAVRDSVARAAADLALAVLGGGT